MKYYCFLLSTIFLLLGSIEAKSQNYVYINGIKHEAKKLPCFKRSGPQIASVYDPSLKITKCPYRGGHLMVLYKDEYPDGTLEIFLENGEVIKCYDKKRLKKVPFKVFDIVGIRNVYDFTNEEINLLKRHDIEKIKYKIRKDAYTGIVTKVLVPDENIGPGGDCESGSDVKFLALF